MSGRYKKIKEVMPLSAAKIDDNTFEGTNVLYLLLSSSIFFYLLLSPKEARLPKLI